MSGITLDQLDAIHELLDSLRAHGDVVNCSGEAEFADGTLPAIGDAIYRDAGKLRKVIDAIDAQRLGLPVGIRDGVREEGATYVAFPAYLPANVMESAVRAPPHPSVADGEGAGAYRRAMAPVSTPRGNVRGIATVDVSA